MFAPAALYFPFTHISRAGLAQAGLLFREIIIYHLPHDQLDDYFYQSVEYGLVRLIELDLIEDSGQVRRIIAEFAAWAGQFRGQSNLAWLKKHLQEADSAETLSRLASAIRGRRSPQAVRFDPDREAQVTLHFIRYLEQEQREIDRLMEQVDVKESLLASQIGVDGEPDSGIIPARPASGDTSTGRNKDFIPQSIPAWGRCYLRKGPADTALFTDCVEAVDWLDQGSGKIRASSSLLTERGTEALEPFFGIDLPLPEGVFHKDGLNFKRIAEGREELKKGLGSGWAGLISRMTRTALTGADLLELKKEAEATVDGLRAKLHARGEKPGLRLAGYLIPGNSLREAYLAAAGLKADLKNEDKWSGPIFALRKIEN